MKPILKMLAVVGLMLTSTAGLANVANAGEELGQFCWSLTPYVDTVRISASVVNGQVPMFHVLAEWHAGPAPANQTVGGGRTDTRITQYNFVGTGTALRSRDSHDPPNTITIGIVGARTFGLASEFGGQEICKLVMSISTDTLNGRFQVICPGIQTLPLNLSATAIFHPCSTQE
jgi:hypothetical protein